MIGRAISGTATINYEVLGDSSEALVFLHGNGESKEIFKDIVDAYVKDYKLILIDSRGQGGSSFGKEKFRIEQMAKDVIKVLDDEKIHKASFIGFSDGANIALTLARDYSNRVRCMVIIGANTQPSHFLWYYYAWLRIKYLALGCVSMFKKPREARKLLSLMIYEPNITKSQLNAIKTPTMVIAGQKDFYISIAHSRYIAENIRNAKLSFILGAPHIAFKGYENKFNSIVLPFLLAHKKEA